MNGALKKLISSVDINTNGLIEILEKSGNQNMPVIRGISSHGLFSVELSPLMQVQSCKIHRKRFKDLKRITQNNQNPDEMLCSVIEKEMISACQNAMNKIAKQCNEIADVYSIIKMKDKKLEDIGEFEG